MTESELVVEELFGREAVKQLTAKDFQLDAPIPIQLKHEDCTLILFYGNNQESRNEVEIWAAAAKVVPSPTFAAVNIINEKRVANAFQQVKSKPGPFKNFGLKGYPFIMVYLGGFPKAFYNGDRDVNAIIDYALTLACDPDYVEDRQLAASVHVGQSYEMGGVNEYTPRVDSLDFKAGQPARLYDPSTGLQVTGSQAAAGAARKEEAERGAEGTASPPPETGETGQGEIGAGGSPGGVQLGAGGSPAAVQPAGV